MITILESILIIIFLIISLIHFYWVFGGLKGLNKALPTDETGMARANNWAHMSMIVICLGYQGFTKL